MSNKLRTVLAGCGAISHHWMNMTACKELVEIVGLVDLDTDRARAFAAQYQLQDAVIGASLGEVLAATGPEAVFDCTVPAAHVQVVCEALQHGCHVLGEKPLADTMAHAQEMVQAAQQAGKIYAVIQNRRYDPNIRRLRAFLDSGAIGKITTVQCNFLLAADFGDNFRTVMAHPLVLDMAIHTFDAARLITSARPQSVYCQEWNPAGSWYRGDAAAAAIFEMSEGIVYTYLGSWVARGLNTPWECEWRVIGDQGSVCWDGVDGYRAETLGDDGQCHPVAVPEIDAGAKTGGHDGVIREFVTCVRQGGTPETTATDNIYSLAMVLGAIASSEQGAKVTFTQEGLLVP